MVLISFSVPGLVYKVLKKEKITTIRELNTKWKRVFEKFTTSPDDPIPLTFFHKQRSKYGFKFLDSYIEDLEPYFLEDMTEEEAILDGGESKEHLLAFFQKKYGENYLEKEFLRIFWNLDFPDPERITNPNKTKIDWFSSQQLYSINPLVINKNGQNCFYDCCYCYTKSFYTRLPKKFIPGFYEERLRGLKNARDNVFISSTMDLFHEKIPDDFLRYIIEKANEYNENQCNLYFLTKNPQKFKNLIKFFNPETNYIGATIETNSYQKQQVEITSAPGPLERIKAFQEIDYEKKFISIEPLLHFSNGFHQEIIKCKPSLIFIGANTNKKLQKTLIEPNYKQVSHLIDSLESAGIKVHQKGNLKRLLEIKDLSRQTSLTEFTMEEGV